MRQWIVSLSDRLRGIYIHCPLPQPPMGDVTLWRTIVIHADVSSGKYELRPTTFESKAPDNVPYRARYRWNPILISGFAGHVWLVFMQVSPGYTFLTFDVPAVSPSSFTLAVTTWLAIVTWRSTVAGIPMQRRSSCTEYMRDEKSSTTHPRQKQCDGRSLTDDSAKSE